MRWEHFDMNSQSVLGFGCRAFARSFACSVSKPEICFDLSSARFEKDKENTQ
jgi:hypothetical protein